MNIKEVVVETDNGDTITMSMEKVEDFFASVERLKRAANPEKPKEQINVMEDERIAYMLRQQAEMERARCEQVILQQQAETSARYTADALATTSSNSSVGEIKSLLGL